MTANEDFFREKRAAAVFKHGILRRYPVIFASKAGSRVEDRRVVFVDGYAGRGRYEDGSPGSPLLLVQAAEFVTKFRNVTGVFVEKNPQHYARLERLLAEEARGLNFETLQGDLGERLPEVLSKARDAALFVFLDPFGTALAHEELLRILHRKGPPTEVLLHFSVSAVARLGSAVKQMHAHVNLPPEDEKKIDRLNRFLGGDWWQTYFAQVDGAEDLGTATSAALAVCDQYRKIIKDETAYDSVSMPVRPHPDNQPRYVLVLFTGHVEGKWYFADALGKAGMDWHEAWRNDVVTRRRRKQEALGQGALFEMETEPPVFDRDRYRKTEEPKWIAAIEENLRELLAAYGTFRMADHVAEVYGTTLGSAWIPHVRKAAQNLHETGLIGDIGKDKRLHLDAIVPITPS
ncbi:three-Cys-motif partner protein TcmP [Sphaerisporangium sp. NPDC051017]|uniref:three-Cys-motif partner protein TcmP n=1 Tax=Sphaerisporangium sp. NPDC051017 TaxID=3154636 RepID=UPI00344219F8